MLGLRSRTGPEWGARALASLDEVLLDHTHCEKKAASTAINLIFRYAEHPCLMAPLSALAREELAHFEQMLVLLDQRGVAFRRLHPTDYAKKLKERCRGSEPGKLLDTLVVCSLIEARSCERMQAFADALAASGEAQLAGLYRGLLAAEARHHGAYLQMARDTGLFADGEIRERCDALASAEATVLGELAPGPRLHSG